MSLSYLQSSENHGDFYHDIKNTLEKENKHTKITELKILDKLYEKNMINDDYYYFHKQLVIDIDKKDKLIDFYYSFVCSSITLTLFVYYIWPSENHSILKYIYISYLIIVYSLTLMFYLSLNKS